MARAPETKKATLKTMLTAETTAILAPRADLKLVKAADGAADNETTCRPATRLGKIASSTTTRGGPNPWGIGRSDVISRKTLIEFERGIGSPTLKALSKLLGPEQNRHTWGSVVAPARPSGHRRRPIAGGHE